MAQFVVNVLSVTKATVEFVNVVEITVKVVHAAMASSVSKLKIRPSLNASHAHLDSQASKVSHALISMNAFQFILATQKLFVRIFRLVLDATLVRKDLRVITRKDFTWKRLSITLFSVRDAMTLMNVKREASNVVEMQFVKI